MQDCDVSGDRENNLGKDRVVIIGQVSKYHEYVNNIEIRSFITFERVFESGCIACSKIDFPVGLYHSIFSKTGAITTQKT